MEIREGIDAKKFLIFLVLAIILIIFVSNKIKYARINSWITDVKDLVRDPNSSNYVNDLYISDGRHYEHLLNSKEQEDYLKIYNAIKERKDVVELDLGKNEFSNELAMKMAEVIGMDHPELIYFSYLSYLRRDDKAEIHISYSMSESEYQEKLQKVTNIIENIKEETKDMNDYEKCKYVYEWLGKTNLYGDPNGVLAHSAYSAFDENTLTVCEGFAKASQIIFQNIGVNSVYVVGRRNNGGLHAWNLVKIDGKYYCYDATCSVSKKSSISDPISYTGFLVKDVNSYKPSSYCKKLLPKVDGKKYIGKIKD